MPKRSSKPLVESNQQVEEPPWFTEVYLPKLRPIFREAIESPASHARLSAVLRAIYEKSNKEDFWQALIECANYGLTSPPKLAAGTAIIDLLVKFAHAQFAESAAADASSATTATTGASASTAATGIGGTSSAAAGTSADDDEEELGMDLDDPDCIAGRLISYCMELHCAAAKGIRMRCIQLLYRLFSGLPRHITMTDELFARIRDCLTARAWDVSGPVRAECARAMNRFQTPNRRTCPVIDVLEYIIRHDPSAEVRRTALRSIALTTKTLVTVASRTRDVDDSVRRAAYEMLSSRSNIFRTMSILCRVTTLSGGLCDTSPAVAAAAKKLGYQWLDNVEGRFVGLLRKLDVTMFTDHCQQILAVLMPDRLPAVIEEVTACLDERHLLKPEFHTSEAALLWRRLVRLLEERKDADTLEKILPGGLDYQQLLGDVLQRQVTDPDLLMDWVFLVRQLLKLGSSLDLSDAFTHDSLLRQLREALKTAPADLTEDLLCLCRHVYGKEAAFSDAGIELITDIRCAARDAVDLPDCDDEVTPEDEATLERCNLIAWKLLWLCESRRLSPAQRSLVDTLVLPSVKHQGNRVRLFAVSALGIACDRDRGLALTHLPLLLQIAKLDFSQIRVAALGGIFDCFLVFGLDTFVQAVAAASSAKSAATGRSDLEADFLRLISDSADDLFRTNLQSQQSVASTADSAMTATEAVSSLLAHPIEQLDSEVSTIRTICVEGLTRLLLFGHVISPKLVSRLFLLWYNPETEADHQLRHCLAQFFTTYSSTKREYQMSVAESAIYSLRTLFKAPAASRLHEVDHNNVAELLVVLTNAENLYQHKQLDEAALAGVEQAAHDDLAVRLANEISRSPNGAGISVYVRMISILQVRGVHRAVYDTLAPIITKVKERQAYQTLYKYIAVLADRLGVDQAPATAAASAATAATAGAAAAAAEANAALGAAAGTTADEDDEPVLLADSQGNDDEAAGFIGQRQLDNRRKAAAAASGALNSTLAPGGAPAPSSPILMEVSAVAAAAPLPAAAADHTFRTPFGQPPKSAAKSAKAAAAAAAARKRPSAGAGRMSTSTAISKAAAVATTADADDATDSDSVDLSFLVGPSKKTRGGAGGARSGRPRISTASTIAVDSDSDEDDGGRRARKSRASISESSTISTPASRPSKAARSSRPRVSAISSSIVSEAPDEIDDSATGRGGGGGARRSAKTGAATAGAKRRASTASSSSSASPQATTKSAAAAAAADDDAGANHRRVSSRRVSASLVAAAARPPRSAAKRAK